MSKNTFTSWQTPSAPPGGNSQTDFGPQPVFRNAKDLALSGYQRGADTQYPDGYLGTMSANRRQDKILGSLSRMNARQYSRGVHKGERINAGDDKRDEAMEMSLERRSKLKSLTPNWR